jgi:CheY-like chemotaxis protein
MPVQDGLETISRLRRDAPALRIIAMSGGRKTRQADYLRTASDLGASATLEKPFDAEQLLAGVQKVLGN